MERGRPGLFPGWAHDSRVENILLLNPEDSQRKGEEKEANAGIGKDSDGELGSEIA